MFDFICAVLSIFFAVWIPAAIIGPVLFGGQRKPHDTDWIGFDK